MAFNVSRILLAACGALVALHAGAVEIMPLGARSYNITSITTGGDVPTQYVVNTKTDLSSTASVSGSATVSTATTDASRPLAEVSIVANPTDLQEFVHAVAESDFYYDYTVVGATGPVPVGFYYDVRIATTSNSDAEAFLQVTNSYTYDAPALEIGFNNSQVGFGTHELAGNASTNAYEGQVDEVVLSARVETYGAGSATAFADPRIYIDPAYLATHPGVSLVIAEGVGNLGPITVTPVPEPANSALLFGGLSLLAALRRRRA